MSIAQSLLPEFDQEMANTRKVLERVPDDKWNWKPHEKSGTTGWLAGHVGTVPEWLTMTLNSESLDYAPVDGPTYTPRNDHESFDPPSRATHRLFALAQCSRSGSLRTIRRRIVTWKLLRGISWPS